MEPRDLVRTGGGLASIAAGARFAGSVQPAIHIVGAALTGAAFAWMGVGLMHRAESPAVGALQPHSSVAC